MKKVLGMGNALTDILLRIESDDCLSQLNLPKGSMQLVDSKKTTEINALLAHLPSVMAAGGSASNTINGISKLGGTTGFIGKIGQDAIGTFFSDDMKRNGVHPLLAYSKNASGQCTVLVSADGERTMCTSLGAACELSADDLTAEMFKGYDIFHIEGYLVLNNELIRKAVQLAKAAGMLVSIDLASYNVVEDNLAFLQEIVREYVDIVFANEDEARAFTAKEPEDALIHISEHCDIAVVKVGKAGSYVKSGTVQLKANARLAECIDTTGAGDLYAAGFLYGLSLGYSLPLCAEFGSLVAGNVVQVMGAKMENHIWESIQDEIQTLLENEL